MINFNKKLLLVSAYLLFSVGAVVAASQVYNVVLEIIGQVDATVRWAVPEGRVGAPATNWDSTFYLKVTPSDDNDKTPLFVMDDLETTDVTGEFATPISLTGVSNGTYDVSFKSHQHLSVKLDNVALSSSTTSLNFTQADNSVPLGSLRLLAGDISGAGTSPATLGDNVINSVDLSIMLNSIDMEDPTTRSIRANLNQDPVVNSVDLSLMLKNLDKQGDY
jgi:hypothetical protein